MEQIMNNEEIMNVTEEVATTNSGKAVKAVVGIGVAALAGTVLYKRVLKPVVAKFKAKKEAKKAKAQEVITFDELDEAIND